MNTSPQPENGQQSQSSEVIGLTEQIKKLVTKLDVPKQKDFWDRISVLTPFVGTVVLGGLSLYLTQSYQANESKRTREFQQLEAERTAQLNQAQIDMQRAQIRIEELKAITSFAPLLTSDNPATRDVANKVLKALQATGSPVVKTQTTDQIRQPVKKPADIAVSTSLIDSFAATASSPATPTEGRIEAVRRIGAIATAKSTNAIVREHAADIVAQLASSEKSPPEVRRAAADIIAQIKQVDASEVVQMIATQPLTRDVKEIILHSSATPASSYKGAQTLLSFANFQLGSMAWSHVGWHYAIAPDGTIWLGAPLNERATHVAQHNEGSVSVLLIMDGNKELPTNAQRSSLALLLRALSARLKIDLASNSSDSSGFHFHQDYNSTKQCPGALLTKELVVGWLGSTSP